MTTPMDLAVPSERRLWQKATLKEPTVLQSFAFDEANKHLYVLQATATGHAAGDLCLNKLDYKGNRLGAMHLKGFGHGVSMGIQRDAKDGSTWIWTEADAENGFGQGVTRFHFADGAVRTGADVRIRKPVPGSSNNQPSVCMTSGRIAVRHRDKANKPRYRVGTWTPSPPATTTTRSRTSPRPAPTPTRRSHPASTSPPASSSSGSAPRPGTHSPTASRRASPCAAARTRRRTSASPRGSRGHGASRSSSRTTRSPRAKPGQRTAPTEAFGCARVVFNDAVRAREDA